MTIEIKVSFDDTALSIIPDSLKKHVEAHVKKIRDRNKNDGAEALNDYSTRFLMFKNRTGTHAKKQSWDVCSKDDTILGSVGWHGAWRKYVFEPAEKGIVFDEQCLLDIWRHLKAMSMEETT